VYSPEATFQYAAVNNHTPTSTKKKIQAKITFVFNVNIKNVNNVKPHTIKYIAIPALYPTLAMPSETFVPEAL
jgi:hypothetical protein